MSTANRDNHQLLPPHGGYKKLASYKNAEIIYDGTVYFTQRWVKSWKLKEQIDGAGRSGKQNIAEGSVVSGTSKKSELKLTNVSKGSLMELLEDFEDFLRQRGLQLWGKNSALTKKVRDLAYRKDRSYKTYKSYIESDDPAIAANTLITLIYQTKYLLDRQIQSLETDFLERGGFTERMYHSRKGYRDTSGARTNKTSKTNTRSSRRR